MIAASDALRLNCDSRNFAINAPRIDMMVASVAPAKHRNIKVGFFRRIRRDLKKGENMSHVNAWNNT